MHSRLPAQPSGVCSGIWVLKPLGWSSVGLLAASFSRPLLGSCLFAQGHAFCMKNLDFPASKVSFFMVKASIFLDPNGTSDLCFLFFLGRWPATSSQGLLSRNVVFVCMHTFKTLELFFQRLSHVAALRAAKVFHLREELCRPAITRQTLRDRVWWIGAVQLKSSQDTTHFERSGAMSPKSTLSSVLEGL